MFRVLLYSQWKWSRLVITLGTITAFGLPIVSVQGFARDAASPMRSGEMLSAMQSWGVLYPVLAAALGLAVSAMDEREHHDSRPARSLAIDWPIRKCRDGDK